MHPLEGTSGAASNSWQSHPASMTFSFIKVVQEGIRNGSAVQAVSMRATYVIWASSLLVHYTHADCYGNL